MERAVPSVKWKTTASAACIPRRSSTSPYSTAATVFPTAARTVCSLSSGLGGPSILGCSPLLACWLSIRAPWASCGRPLPSDTAHLTLALPCPPSWGRQAPEASPGSSSNWIYRTAAQGTNALRAWSASVPSSLIASTVIPPALLSTNLASKPRPLVNRTATRCPFHSLDKYPANAPPLSAYILRASYPRSGASRLLRGPSSAVKRVRSYSPSFATSFQSRPLDSSISRKKRVQVSMRSSTVPESKTPKGVISLSKTRLTASSHTSPEV